MREDLARSDLTPPFLVSTIRVGHETYAAHFPQLIRNRRFKHHSLIAISRRCVQDVPWTSWCAS